MQQDSKSDLEGGGRGKDRQKDSEINLAATQRLLLVGAYRFLRSKSYP